MSNWMPVSTFVNFTTKGITPAYVEKSSIIVLNQKCIRNNRIDYSFAQFTDDSKNIPESKFVREGDILVNSTGTGTAGRCAFVSQLPTEHRLIVDSHILILRCDSFNTAQCLSYSLFSFEKTLMSFMTGSSGQSELDKVALLNLKTQIPSDLSTQQKIASVLSALDAKIELNNRINAELEAMAKALYDYWFVQFDFPASASSAGSETEGSATNTSASSATNPVPELVEGKPYKTSGGKMVWNEQLKRNIPEGWVAGTLEDLGTIIGGSTPSKAIPDNFCLGSGTPWITPKDLSLNKGNKFITRGEFDVTPLGMKEASLNLMPKGTVLLSSRAPIGYLAISREVVTTNQGFKSFVPNKGYSTEFVYYSVKNMIPTIEKNAVGSTFKEVSGTTLKSIIISIPSKELVAKYNAIVESIFNKQDKLELENQHLATLRDWLLPMLMNGQVTVRQAHGNEEKEAEKAVYNVEETMVVAAEPGENYKAKK